MTIHGVCYRASVVCAAVLVVGLQGTAGAFETTQSVGPVLLSVYAPDWTWQKRDINILMVARNKGQEAATLSVELVLPVGQEDHFVYVGEKVKTLTAGPGEAVRAAFAGITAKDGVPTQQYVLALKIRAGDGDTTLEYPVQTIRGAAVNPGKWALYLPAGVALIWCAAFALALRRMSGAGAWRRSGPAVKTLPNQPGWVEDVDS
jgi:hypothetical protein